MGATALLMAAHRHPGLFDAIIAYEPIVFPERRDPRPGGPPPIIEGARRRRRSFPSFEEAVENYRSKPPMDGFDPDVLRLYVAHGFGPAPEGVRLKCDPEHEARTFEGGAVHRTWDLLPQIETRAVVIGGGDREGPAIVAEPVAEQLPAATFVHRPDSSHFGPFTDPGSSAEMILDVTR